MTLEKDNEDQSKYYLSYPKLPFLDMKKENHDINVAEWETFQSFLLYRMIIRRKHFSEANGMLNANC